LRELKKVSFCTCQYLNSIDYYILDPDFESDVFWILVHVMQEKGWRDVYKDNTPKLVELLAKLEDGIKRDLPKLYQLFDENVKFFFGHLFISLGLNTRLFISIFPDSHVL